MSSFSASGRTMNGADDSSALDDDVLPDERVELFFSIVLRDGTEDNGRSSEGVGTVCHDRSALFARGRHLQWALHRGIEHGCQPAMFWRTPFLRDGSEVGEEECLLETHLSQAAHDFVYGEAPSSRAGEGGGGDGGEDGGGMMKAKRAPVLVYIVSQESMAEQSGRIRRMWQAASERESGKRSRIGSVKAVCVNLRPRHFGVDVITVPESSLPMAAAATAADLAPTPVVDRNRKGPVRGDPPTLGVGAGILDECDVPVDRLAMVRGAGLMLGYPAIVFDCNASSAAFACADINGKVLEHGAGEGLLARLRSQLNEGDCASIPFRDVEQSLDRVFLTGERPWNGDDTESLISCAVRELLANLKLVVSSWLYRTFIPNVPVSTAQQEESEAALLGRNDRADMRGDNLPSFSSPLFAALYERNNQKRTIFLTGAHSNLLGTTLTCDGLLGLSQSGKNCVEVPAWNSVLQNEFFFPWNDSLPIKLTPAGHARKQRSQRCPVSVTKHLGHYGVTASIAGRVMSARILSERRTQRDEEQKRLIGMRVAKQFVVPVEWRISFNKRRKTGGKDSNRKSEEARIFLGCVADVVSSKEEDGEVKEPKNGNAERADWFLIRYDDGDAEHVDKHELDGMLRLYSVVGENVQSKLSGSHQDLENSIDKSSTEDSRLRSSSSSRRCRASSSTTAPSSLESARLFLTKRVAKKFGKVGGTFFGSVIDCYEASSDAPGSAMTKSSSKNLPHSSTVWRVRFDDGDEEYFTKDDLNSALRLYSKTKLYDKHKTATIQARGRRR